MPLSFQLVDQPWLPVRFRGERTSRDVSLAEALTRAHDIERLADPSPAVTAALPRLLIAVAHAAVAGPRDHNAWAALWERGRFEPAQLAAYLDRVRPAFDLFDPERPFFQTAGLPPRSSTTVAKMGHEYCVGANSVLMDHNHDDVPPAMSAALAARLLVVQQSFSIGGTLSRLPGDSPSAEASHLMKAAVVLAMGDNLFETLLLNMVGMDGRLKRPFDFDPENDAPAWERATPTTASARKPDGYLDFLTWQSRRVLLFPEDDGSVRRAVIMAGFSFPAGFDAHDYETMVAYAAKEKLGWMPLGFRPERALWRDSVSLLLTSDALQVPRTVRWLGDLKRGYIDETRTFSLSGFGFATFQAKVFLWRAEEFPLPAAYLENAPLLTLLEQGLKAAEDAARALRFGTWKLADLFLAPGGNADQARVKALVESLAPQRGFWPALDLPFRVFARELAAEFAATGEGAGAQERWSDAIRAEAEAAFERAREGIEESPGRGYRAAAEAEPAFGIGLFKALAPIRPVPVAREGVTA